MTTNYHTPIPSPLAAANAATINAPMGQLDLAVTNLNTSVNNLIAGVTQQITLENSGNYQITTGVINVVDDIFVMLQSETGTTDNLDSINGADDNSLLFVKPITGHTITITDAGNISNTPVVLDDTMAALLLFENSQWSLIGPSAGSGSTYTPQIAILRDEKASGTNAGGSAATTWNARNLNTEVADSENIVTIASNQFTPIAGTYKIFATAPVFNSVGVNRLRLYNVTDASVVDHGPNYRNSSTTDMSNATLNTIFTANGTDAYRIDHYTGNAVATNGLGANMALGVNEIYLEIVLERLGS